MTAEEADAPVPPCVVVDVSCYRTPDLPLVDALLRVRLVTCRLGAGLLVVGAGPDLRRLLALLGLLSVVPLGVAEASERGRQPEALEQPRVEEVVDVHDPPVPQLEHLDRPGFEPPAGGGLVLGEGG
jgi:hypothetical protein